MINFFENTVMAMQTGVGLSKILILAGAGYTGTVLLKNGKLSDILGELQSLVKGLEKSGEQADDSDALLAQVRRLSTESRQLASARQITVLNGDSGGIRTLFNQHKKVEKEIKEMAKKVNDLCGTEVSSFKCKMVAGGV
ncbi:hypothetical protein ERO13_D02G057300v2 [Gossypium hirsutum]|uniref:Uncharacterized protein isoform X1 n=2 Tax=Gossypium hirsutum TaxID=3635 RepID=A0A1U8JR10_GOSHI|nr:uncharacterized protein LOC107908514 isoform X1 [Gossypium hirsutum]KAG4157344.1 hypothetical protein ERO13_D02G057300v2 [Gossypium hirsutum]